MESYSQQSVLPSEGPWQVLLDNPDSARTVVHSLLNGKHIDPYLAEEFRFIENHPAAWEEFFQWMGYRLRRSELGGSPFYYLEARREVVNETRLSRGATFLGLYMAWHFFMQGPGEPEYIDAEEIFRRLVSSYPFHFLRAVFIRKSAAPSIHLELSEDQAEKLRGYLRRDFAELAKYRFVDVRPNARAAWPDLVVHRLPALYRFWELALHVRTGAVNGREPDIDEVVALVWGSMESEPEEEEP